ncbi:META domain-containing protein [Nonlabens xiamenensis]|uniref:META domain-containing protein n=1 Tax=Nonlabens xiamenensis TaxID=2341043 RepID=UPI000F60D051|nr:META domain-containing protein [Nonlabens xiamenensis]
MKLLSIIFGLFLLVQAQECGENKTEETDASALTETTADSKSMKDWAGQYNVTMVGENDYTEHDITIEVSLGEESRISGYSSCNQYSGPISNPKENKLEIGMLMSTKMYCENTADIERDYMNHLSQVDAYSMEEGKLHLLDESGETLITALPATEKKN